LPNSLFAECFIVHLCCESSFRRGLPFGGICAGSFRIFRFFGGRRQFVCAEGRFISARFGHRFRLHCGKYIGFFLRGRFAGFARLLLIRLRLFGCRIFGGYTAFRQGFFVLNGPFVLLRHARNHSRQFFNEGDMTLILGNQFLFERRRVFLNHIERDGFGAYFVGDAFDGICRFLFGALQQFLGLLPRFFFCQLRFHLRFRNDTVRLALRRIDCFLRFIPGLGNHFLVVGVRLLRFFQRALLSLAGDLVSYFL